MKGKQWIRRPAINDLKKEKFTILIQNYHYLHTGLIKNWETDEQKYLELWAKMLYNKSDI